MFGKKYIFLLVGLAVASVVVSAALSALLGGRTKAPAPHAPAPGAPGRAEMLLGSLAGGDEKPLPGQKEVNELVRELRLRLEEVQRREAELTRQERRVRLAEEALQARAKELEALRMELVGPLARLKEAMAELERSRVKVGQQEKANIQRIAATFERMEAEGGSGILTGICANNQTDDVVKILYYMSERSSAKLLAAMTDKALAARLTALMQRVEEGG